MMRSREASEYGLRKNAALVAGVPGPLRAILGPCPCQSCGQPVYLARSITRLLGREVPGMLIWRDRTGGIHGCNPLARIKRGTGLRRAA